jgi:DNA-binding CsgD family transcriptional regulator/tetratricopeptide (TPR) repeat protein
VHEELLNDTVFVGRGEELAAIRSVVEAASGGRARVVWVEGDAGSGKTALVRRVLEELPADFTMLRAEADELAVNASMAVAGQLGPTSSDGPFGAGVELLELLGTLQDSGPVAVIVEDLHWADAASRQALLTTARRLGDDRVVMLVTSRPGAADDDGWGRLIADPDRCQRVTLGVLSTDEVAELAGRSGVPMTRRAAERLHRHTGGHPLYVQTLLRELTPDQLTMPEGELPAPRSLASATLARLADLPPEALALVCALAVVNRRAPLALVARIGEIAQAATALDGALATGFVTWSPTEPQTPIQFVHPLFRTAVYDDLPPTKRQSLHRAAAEALGPTVGLTHRVAAADGVDDALAGDLIEAAHHESTKGDRSQAAAYLLSASSLESNLNLAERHLLEAASLLLAEWQTKRVDSMKQSVEACESGTLRSFVLGLLAWDQGDAITAERWLTDVVACAGPEDAGPDVLAAALSLLGILTGTQGRAREAVEAATRSLGLKPSDPYVEQQAWTALAVGEALLGGGVAGLRRLSERLPQAPEAVPVSDMYLLVIRGTLGYYAGRTTSTIADLRGAVRLARDSPATMQLPRAHVHLAQALLHSGDWGEALVHARIALSLTSDERRMWIEAQAHATLGTLLAYRGEWDDATQHVIAARQAASELSTLEASWTTLMAEASLARAQDEPARIIEALTPMVNSPTMISPLAWWPSLVVATLRIGDIGAAKVLITKLEKAADARGMDLRARIVGLHARVALARGRTDEAAIGFAQSIALFGDDDPLLDRAQLHHAYGNLLRDTGDRRHALEQLRTTHQLLDTVDAEPFRARVAADLETCGIRAVGRADHSPFAFTDRENDVVALVAKGMTNREVAAELYVSEKAVEYHLRNIFGKLGIRSRRELRGFSIG